MEQYSYLFNHGLKTKSQCDALFSNPGQSSWCLMEKPQEGFLIEFLQYQKEYHPELSITEVGSILLNIDPWMGESVSSPHAAYTKACRLKRKRSRHQFNHTVVYKLKKQRLEDTADKEVLTVTNSFISLL